MDSWPGHEWSKFPTQNYYKWCRMTLKARRRAPLGDITNVASSGGRIRGRSTLGGCQKCNTYLCSTGTCFGQFHSFKLRQKEGFLLDVGQRGSNWCAKTNWLHFPISNVITLSRPLFPKPEGPLGLPPPELVQQQYL